MKPLIASILVIVGFINLFPVIGIVSMEKLGELYGIAAIEGDLLILMRHRALLFGILGTFMIYAAFRRHLQPAAVCMGLVSMLGFIGLLLLADDYGARLYRIAIIDAVASVPLIVAGVLLFRNTELRLKQKDQQ